MNNEINRNRLILQIAASALATNTTNTTTPTENGNTTAKAQPLGVAGIVAIAVGFLVLLFFSVALSILLLRKKKTIDKDDLSGKLAVMPQFKAEAKGEESKVTTSTDPSLPNIWC